ncbi:hypothetical protein F5983_35160 [Streptomyces arboris]|uniref:Uncharacterized protein n=1 Tax=Streptomyces arboris TaxID=2600619 RepID=A0A5N5EH60_9ACTN|nr:hypothetical protein F5983_35160 [Streptomyces arboris]
MTAWAAERSNFTYPTGSANGEPVGSYTQMVWAQSEWVGAAYSYYFDRYHRQAPYAHLFAVNFGPGGNDEGQAPYPLA